MLARDLTISFFLGDRDSALIAFRRFRGFALLCQFLILHGGCENVGGWEDSVVEHCGDSVVDVDGDCDIEASISSLFLLRYAALATLFFLNKSFCIFNGVHYLHGKTLNVSVKIVPISDIIIFLTVTFSR